MVILHTFFLLALNLLVESPFELARSGDQQKMVEVLAKLRNLPPEDVADEANKINEEEQEREKNLNMLAAVRDFDKTCMRKLAIILVVFSFTHLSGITVITTFLIDIFSRFGIPAIWLVMASSVSEMFFSFLQMVIADKIGR